MKIGDSVWKFDGSHRVEPKNWREMKIVGETSRSWICKESWCEYKMPKSNPDPMIWSLSWEEVLEKCWARKTGWKIAEAVKRVQDPGVLRQIAHLIEWRERD